MLQPFVILFSSDRLLFNDGDVPLDADPYGVLHNCSVSARVLSQRGYHFPRILLRPVHFVFPSAPNKMPGAKPTLNVAEHVVPL